MQKHRQVVLQPTDTKRHVTPVNQTKCRLTPLKLGTKDRPPTNGRQTACDACKKRKCRLRSLKLGTNDQPRRMSTNGTNKQRNWSHMLCRANKQTDKSTSRQQLALDKYATGSHSKKTSRAQKYGEDDSKG